MSHPSLDKIIETVRSPTRRALNAFGIRRAPRVHNAFATHLPLLVGAARLFKPRRIAEFGCGRHSTLTFLDRRAFPELEILHSYETDAGWASEMAGLTKTDARVRFTAVPGPMSLAARDVDFHRYDLVFIDDSLTYEERAETIHAVAAGCDASNLIMIHDFESPLYRQAATAFQHSFAFTALLPQTGLAWNNAAVEVKNLSRLDALVKRHARRIKPEDLEGWTRLIRGKDWAR